MDATLNSIPRIIFNRLSNISSRIDKCAQIKVYTQYPVHANVLIRANLAPKMCPSVKTLDEL